MTPGMPTDFAARETVFAIGIHQSQSRISLDRDFDPLPAAGLWREESVTALFNACARSVRLG
jgi:hypothetical protein